MGSTVLSQRVQTTGAVRPWPSWVGLVTAITLLALAISSATAHAAGFVQIVPVGGTGGQTVDLSQIGQPDVTDHSYSTVATPGGAPQTVTVTAGYSLPKLFKNLDISTTFGSAEIVAPVGPPIVLDNTQAITPNAYHGGLPVVWADGAGEHFLVPRTPSGNTNAGETFTAQGGTITIKLHSGLPLAVGISGTPTPAVVDKPVQFHSTVGAPPASLLYQWSFGDNTTGSQAAPSHVYTAIGTYSAYLQVSGGHDSVGASRVIHIVVGNPPRGTSGTGGAGAGSGNGSGAGGTRGSGAGAGPGSHTTTTTQIGAKSTPVPPAPSKRSPHPRPQRVPRPTGPLV
ncbi:MAG: PKD domain-containing protein, partial [Actinomycetota bacterium]|nr:PKD domain-containing protein [Actinomycetota bacterium]